jgi:hypothetical protein
MEKTHIGGYHARVRVQYPDGSRLHFGGTKEELAVAVQIAGVETSEVAKAFAADIRGDLFFGSYNKVCYDLPYGPVTFEKVNLPALTGNDRTGLLGLVDFIASFPLVERIVFALACLSFLMWGYAG